MNIIAASLAEIASNFLHAGYLSAYSYHPEPSFIGQYQDDYAETGRYLMGINPNLMAALLIAAFLLWMISPTVIRIYKQIHSPGGTKRILDDREESP